MEFSLLTTCLLPIASPKQPRGKPIVLPGGILQLKFLPFQLLPLASYRQLLLPYQAHLPRGLTFHRSLPRVRQGQGIQQGHQDMLQPHGFLT